MKKEKEVLDTIPEEEPKFADHIGFNELYTVKGLPGLFITVGAPNKSGLIALREWGKNLIDRKVKMAKVKDIVNMGHYIFNTLDTKIIQVPVDDSEVKELQKEGLQLTNDIRNSQKDPERFQQLIQELDAINEKIKEITTSDDWELEDTEVPVVLTITDVFNNLYEVFEDSTLEPAFTYKNLEAQGKVEEVMQAAVPNYDPEEFKKYHLRDCIKWFNLTRRYLEELSEV